MMKYKSKERIRLTHNYRNHPDPPYLPDLVYRIAWIADDRTYVVNIEAANMRFTRCIAYERDILPAPRYEVGRTMTDNEPCVITDGDSVVCVCPGSKGTETAHKIAALLNKEKSP